MNGANAIYDVVIMGGGLAGLSQARHLLLNIPGIKVAIVDPRTREQMLKIDKIGESMVEIAALFMYKELGLYEYLVENHPPKNGLNFHWPRSPDRTGSMDDYYSVWNNRNPPIASFQLQRGRFEVDLLQMNKEMGAKHILGKVKDVELTSGDALNLVQVKTTEGEAITLKARHLVDAAGRSFIIGKKKDNILRGPENLGGLNNGAAWVRVKGVDRTRFHSGYDPKGATTSHYYGTNHFFGHGHWLWMIPIDTEDDSLSIGIMHHHDVIGSKEIGSRDKFFAFLKENHAILYDLVKDAELIDFKYWASVAHRSKQMFSPDNWYCIGDAAYFGDAFYSMGTTTIAFAVESVTELVRAKLAGERDVEEKRKAFDDFNIWYSRVVMSLYKYHSKHLGHASVMSWRIYYEYMWWFGSHVPIFVGKWHLQPDYIRAMLDNCELCFNEELYQQMNELVERGDANLGFMDCYRADQLMLGYHTPKHFDHFVENSRYAPKKLDIYWSTSMVYFYAAFFYAKFQWRGYGFKGITRGRSIYHFFRLLKQSAKTAIRSLIHRVEMLGTPQNEDVHRMRMDFKGYRHQPRLNPWRPDQKKDEESKAA